MKQLFRVMFYHEKLRTFQSLFLIFISEANDFLISISPFDLWWESEIIFTVLVQMKVAQFIRKIFFGLSENVFLDDS